MCAKLADSACTITVRYVISSTFTPISNNFLEEEINPVRNEHGRFHNVEEHHNSRRYLDTIIHDFIAPTISVDWDVCIKYTW